MDDLVGFLVLAMIGLAPLGIALLIAMLVNQQRRARPRVSARPVEPSRRSAPLGDLIDAPGVSVERARQGSVEVFEGALPSGRRASVTFQGLALHEAPRPRVTIELPGAPLLSVRRRNATDGLLPEGGSRVIEIGRLVASGGDRRLEDVTVGLGRLASARVLLETAFRDFPIDQILIWDGKLTATLWGPLPLDAYPWLLGALDAIATAAMPPGVELHAVERVRLVAAQGTRCPYCHGGIGAEERETVACDRCGTVLHDDCFRELGRCPILGCGGGPATRAATRERVR